MDKWMMSRQFTFCFKPAHLLSGLLVLLSTMLAFSPLYAAEDGIERASKTLDQIEKAVRRDITTEADIKSWTRSLTDISTLAADCVQGSQSQLEKIGKDMDILGEADRKEPREVASKRRELVKQQQSAENMLASCKVLSLRSGELTSRVNELQKELLAQRLLARGTPSHELISKNLAQSELWFEAVRLFFAQSWLGASFDAVAAISLMALALFSAGLGFWIRKKVSAWQPVKGRSFSSQLLASMLSTYGYYAPYLLLAVSIALLFRELAGEVRPLPLFASAGLGLPVFVMLLATTEVFLRPRQPARGFLLVDESLARALARRFKVLAVLLLIGYVLFTAVFIHQATEVAYLLLRSAYAMLLAIHLFWAVWLLGRDSPTSTGRWLRLFSYGLVLLILAAEWAGYRNLSSLLARAVLGSLLVIGCLIVFSHLVQDLFEGIEQGKTAAHRVIRKLLGVRSDEHVPGLIWFHVLTVLSLWGLAIFILLHIWGVSATVIDKLVFHFTDGFTLGSLQIVPLRILLALVSFAILLSISGWFKNRLERRWLPRTRIERGTREAMVIISGYTGVAIALLVALGIAGVAFTNLAIIAGALSVGIGFGLQNIVNNFISGLILLFERPIKTGDWIVVGNTEGHVKKIRIRSTQIQTFDRADVIVPNSELISTQVTNWMLQDSRGRARVPVGVAYGSDTEKVKEILLELAENHPSVISHDENLQPKVIFRAFGDSSLQFELRCFVRNVDDRLQVISDLNFAIDKAFRENGVEIPFPQRDLHLRNWPGNPAGGKEMDED